VYLGQVCTKGEPIGPVVEVPEKKQPFDAPLMRFPNQEVPIKWLWFHGF